MSCLRENSLELFGDKTTYGCSYLDPQKKVRDFVHRGPHKHAKENYYVHPDEHNWRQKPYTPKSSDTLRKFRCMLPFDAFFEAKPITRTHPEGIIFDPDYKPAPLVNDEVIKTRPRIYKVPEICLDDIEEPNLRKIIIDNMYSSDWKKKCAETRLVCTKRKIANSVFPSPLVGKVHYDFDLVNRFPVEYLQKCREWDAKYPNHVCNQTELFWSTFKHPYSTPVGEKAFQNLMSDETRLEIRDLVKKNELRTAFDLPISNYMGYMPNRDAGQLKKPSDYKSPYTVLLKEDQTDKKVE